MTGPRQIKPADGCRRCGTEDTGRFAGVHAGSILCRDCLDTVFTRDTRDFTDLDDKIPAELATRMALATERASEAFWAKIVELFPEVQSGDFGPEETDRMERDQAYAVYTWLYWNWPHRSANPDDFDPAWDGPATERDIDNAEREAVVQRLTRLGISATHEYPGVVAIHLRNGLEVWTGLHGWEYGSWSVNGEPIESGRIHDALVAAEVMNNAGAEEFTCPDRIARLWRDIAETAETLDITQGAAGIPAELERATDNVTRSYEASR